MAILGLAIGITPPWTYKTQVRTERDHFRVHSLLSTVASFTPKEGLHTMATSVGFDDSLLSSPATSPRALRRAGFKPTRKDQRTAATTPRPVDEPIKPKAPAMRPAMDVVKRIR
jgi:hypothetical protein